MEIVSKEKNRRAVEYVLHLLLDEDMDPDLKVVYQKAAEAHNQQSDELGNAGFDLFVPEPCSLQRDPVEVSVVQRINYKIRCEMIRKEWGVDENDCIVRSLPFYLYPRSSCTLSNGVGIIDAGYRGRLQASVRSFDDFVTYERGRRIVQVCHPSLHFFRVRIVDSITDFHHAVTDRGEGGFGSSGTAGVAAAAAPSTSSASPATQTSPL